MRLKLFIAFLLAAVGSATAQDIFAAEDSVVANPYPYLITLRHHRQLPDYELRTAVFDRYDIGDTLSLTTPSPSDSLFESTAFDWLDDAVFQNAMIRQARQRFMIANPEQVHYVEALLPEPPRKYHAVVDPLTARLTFVEDDGIIVAPKIGELKADEIKKRHWIHLFDGRLQFAQAYVSPNWYQGGSNNLTMLVNLNFDVKLNRNYHPNLLAEFSASYKLNIHGTPEDSLRNYNIAEDLLQLNAKFGVRAAKKWFYSVTAMFKTQFFHSFEINNPDLKAAFMSPGELNVGLGMTYSNVNKRKTVKFDASVSPLSWNMKTCLNRRMDPVTYNIDAGHRVAHEFGSSAEVKFEATINYNIHYTTRLFIFTDYSYIQGDWENTVTFDINRFLSTQLQFRLRYDSSTPRVENSRWHLWQINEVLSFGFNYRFSTL
jgi:hypothetical protein